MPLVMTHMANMSPRTVTNTIVPQMISVIRMAVFKLTPPYFGGIIFGARPKTFW